MDQYIDPKFLEQVIATANHWLFDHILTVNALLQVVVVAAAFALSIVPSRVIEKILTGIVDRERLYSPIRALLAPLIPLSKYLSWAAFLWLGLAVGVYAELPRDLLRVVVSLLSAWIVIRYVSNIVRDHTLSRLIAFVAWVVAALNIVGLLDDTITILDDLAINFGDFRLSLLLVIKAVFALALLLWIATVASRLLERRISSSPNLTPSVQVLLVKLIKAAFIVVAVVAALNAVGIDLTAFTVFGGALGLGIGFGLQKVISNLVSGIILLLDKSIKPGDVIAVAGTYGWIKSLGARYASVITRDGIEHLIPNEELITTRVENWSYTDRNVRIKLPVGISYGSNLRRAMELCVQAAQEVERVIDNPAPKCLVVGFGDNSVDLEIRIWIRDAHNGIRNVSSEVLLRVWDLFHENDIEFPFPQRDIHIRDPESLAAAFRTDDQ